MKKQTIRARGTYAFDQTELQTAENGSAQNYLSKLKGKGLDQRSD